MRPYTVIRPENHFASRLPHLPGTLVYKLASPRIALARFAEFLVVVGEPLRAELSRDHEQFWFALAGDATLSGQPLGFAYTPAGRPSVLEAQPGARLLWLRKRYEGWPGVPAPSVLHGQVDAVVATPTGTPGLDRAELLPPRDPSFDFNMTLMRFGADVGLPQTEIHDEEHGLYMTQGGGTYYLDGDAHEVSAGDFIYMAPYCPQGFAAGPRGAEYLLYKDVYRDSI